MGYRTELLNSRRTMIRGIHYMSLSFTFRVKGEKPPDAYRNADPPFPAKGSGLRSLDLSCRDDDGALTRASIINGLKLSTSLLAEADFLKVELREHNVDWYGSSVSDSMVELFYESGLSTFYEDRGRTSVPVIWSQDVGTYSITATRGRIWSPSSENDNQVEAIPGGSPVNLPTQDITAELRGGYVTPSMEVFAGAVNSESFRGFRPGYVMYLGAQATLTNGADTASSMDRSNVLLHFQARLYAHPILRDIPGWYIVKPVLDENGDDTGDVKVFRNPAGAFAFSRLFFGFDPGIGVF